MVVCIVDIKLHKLFLGFGDESLLGIFLGKYFFLFQKFIPDLKNSRIICGCFQDKSFNITVIQVYAPTSNAEEAEVERFYEDLQDLLELTPKKDVLFIIGDWNEKVGSPQIPGVTGKFGLGVQNEAEHRLTEICQENALVTANTLYQNTRDNSLNGHHQMVNTKIN